MEWTITIASQLLEDQSRWGELEDDLLDALEQMGAVGLVGFGRVGELCAVFNVEAPAISRAADAGISMFESALRKIAAPVPAIRLEIEPNVEELPSSEPLVERRIRSGGLPVSAITATEAAEILGVSRQRVYQLLEEREDFPRPVTETPRGALWDRGAVELWASKPRGPGRPRKDRPTVGGYPSGGKQVSELAPPPRGSAPGANRRT